MKLGPFDIPGYSIGDCREQLRLLPADSIHCVVTSPPYWGLRDYGTGDAQLGLEATPEEYVEEMVEVFREVRRVLRPDGTCWLNLGDMYITKKSGSTRNVASGMKRRHIETKKARETRRDLKKRNAVDGPNRNGEQKLGQKQLVGMPWRVALALQADGWILRCDVIWNKTNPLPESIEDRPTRCHEYLFLLAKSAKYHYDKEAVKVEASSNTHPRGRNGIQNRRHGYGVNPKAAASNGTGSRQNESFSEAIGAPVSHRNKRSVWTIPTSPYHGAHYATFPEKLIEPCILAGSAARVCGVCGAPWKRLVAVDYVNPGNRTTNGPRSIDQRHETAGFAQRLERRTKTIGWEHPCDHDDSVRGSSVVLDPFMGSGTVGMVAEKNGRLWLGFDNDPKCERLIRERTSQQSLPGVAQC